MSGNPRLRKLARTVAEMPETPSPAPAALEPCSSELARELDRALGDELQRYRLAREKLADRPDPSQPLPPEYVDALLAKPAEEVSFFDLERLARIDTDKFQARWDGVKETASKGFANGWHAARALEYMGGSAWERACFLALRQQLRRAWPPRDDGEALLLDELAQYELIRRQWIGVLAMRSRDPRTVVSLGGRTLADDDRKLTAAAATQEALKTVERMQRLIHNVVRTLANLRRVKAPVIVRRAGQVNVSAGPQLNLQTAPPADPPELSRAASVRP